MTTQLHGTPLSHFTRKIRVLLDELGVEYDFVRPPGVLLRETAAYGGNPLMRVPTLVDGEDHIFESDHIARHVVTRLDPGDRFGVTTTEVEAMNRLAAMNGVMANEVTLILAKRAGGVDLAAPYFAKLVTAIETALAWLDARIDPDAPGFDYRDIVLVCMWQHLEHYGLVPLTPYGRLAARVRRFADRPSVAASTPDRSLADAKAAGWTPG
jgi:glutathione S-transferase